MFGDEFSYRRHQLYWNVHYCLSRIFKGGFVFSQSLLLSLLLIASNNMVNSIFVPTLRKFTFFQLQAYDFGYLFQVEIGVAEG